MIETTEGVKECVIRIDNKSLGEKAVKCPLIIAFECCTPGTLQTAVMYTGNTKTSEDRETLKKWLMDRISNNV